MTQRVTVVEELPQRVTLEWRLRISDKSSLKQTIIVSATDEYITFENDIDWHENRKILKVE